MRDFAARTAGAMVEEKTGGLAWHYRLVEPELGVRRAFALRLALTRLLERAPAEILPGAKVIEVVARGVHKGRLIPFIVARVPAGALLVAIGDDRTDEDLFAALPPGSLAIHVSPGGRSASLPCRPSIPARLTRDLLSPSCDARGVGPAIATRNGASARDLSVAARRVRSVWIVDVGPSTGRFVAQ
jgi:trehalose 6-phosphate synthase/phosphatase